MTLNLNANLEMKEIWNIFNLNLSVEFKGATRRGVMTLPSFFRMRFNWRLCSFVVDVESYPRVDKYRLEIRFQSLQTNPWLFKPFAVSSNSNYLSSLIAIFSVFSSLKPCVTHRYLKLSSWLCVFSSNSIILISLSLSLVLGRQKKIYQGLHLRQRMF